MNTLHSFAVLTSNPKKSQDFLAAGFSVRPFKQDIAEVLSPDVSCVAHYKSADSNIDLSIVEDTAFTVEGLSVSGTLIKHVWSAIESDSSLHGSSATWEVALCLKEGDNYWIAKSATEGILRYPKSDTGYHFDALFAVEYQGRFIHFEHLPDEAKPLYSPRFKAIQSLTYAICSGDRSQLIQMNAPALWTGEYQTNEPIHFRTRPSF